MIYFVTDSERHKVTEPIVSCSVPEGRHILTNILFRALHTDKLIGYDVEATGLDPYKHKVLLKTIGDEQDQVVIDTTSVDWREVITDDYKHLIFVGHNLKYDYKISKISEGFILPRMWDTMIAEQRLTQNCSKGIRGYYTLDNVLLRNLDKKPKGMDKNIRKEFAGVNPQTFTFQDRHIHYAAGDIAMLFELRRYQLSLIKKYNMEFLIDGIEMPLIRYLAEAELDHFKWNEEKWIKLAEANIKERHNVAVKLDQEVIRLRDTLLKPESRHLLRGGKYTRTRNYNPEQINTGLFGEEIDIKALTGKATKVKPNQGNINYNSTDQLLDIFARLGEEAPTTKGNYEVPILDDRGKIANRDLGNGDKFTTGKAAIDVFLMEKRDSPMKKFVELIKEYRRLCNRIDDFGKNWISSFINPVTGSVHTIYRQCEAVNARLQSGDVDNGFYNSQNIPRDGDYRLCFEASEGYSISTHDWEGAEAMIIVSKSQDFRMYELVKADIHSYFVQKGWRLIFNDRANKGLSVKKNRHLAEHFLVTKKINNKEYRQPGKNLTFGGIYNVQDKRASKTIGVTIREARIYLNMMRKEIPKAYRLMEMQSKTAFKQGYLVENSRTNSRIWFPAVINQKVRGIPMDFESKKHTDNQARNMPISGTQADALKEAMVEIGRYIDRHELDCNLMHTVHDELVYRQPLNMDGQSEEWKRNPKYVEYTSPEGEISKVSFPEFVNRTMCDVANRYLNGVKMKTATVVAPTWVK